MCAVLVSINCLNNIYLNNNKIALYIYKLTFSKKLWLKTLLLPPTVSGFGASATKMLVINSLSSKSCSIIAIVGKVKLYCYCGLEKPMMCEGRLQNS